MSLPSAQAHSIDFLLTEEDRAELQATAAPIDLKPFEVLEVRRAVRHATMRPDTARFGDIRAARVLGTPAVHVCGYVDGADVSGNMVGYRPFYLMLYEGLADFDRVEIASPDIAVEHSDCGGAAPPSISCAFQSVEQIMRDLPEKVPSRNTALPGEIEAFCRAANIVVGPPHL